MNKITVIGAGKVGATIAYTLTVNGIAHEIVLIDIDKNKASGEAVDIRQGTAFCGACSVYDGDYSDAAGSNIVVITSGVARKPGQTRLDLAQTNTEIIKSIIPQITKYAPLATYIIVSNPVDILTYAFYKYSCIPRERVIGSGTILDTSRLRSRISEIYSLSQQNVHAYVLGEHGDSSFIPWSLINISNIPIDKYPEALAHRGGCPAIDKAEIEEYVRRSGTYIIERKGATFYAVSMSVCHICKCLLSGIDTTLTVSTVLDGEYGISDVALSVLTLVGNRGAHTRVIVPLNEGESAYLHESAEKLKGVIKELGI